MSGEAAGDDVGTVGRSDHQVAVRHPLEEVLQPHGADDQPTDLTVRAAVQPPRLVPPPAAGTSPAARARPPRRSARPATVPPAGRGTDEVADHPRQPGTNLVDQSPGPPGSPPPRSGCTRDRATCRFPGRRRRAPARRSGGDHVPPAAPARRGVGGVDVQVELDGEGAAGEVAALDDDQVRGSTDFDGSRHRCVCGCHRGVADDRLVRHAPPSATVLYPVSTRPISRL